MIKSLVRSVFRKSSISVIMPSLFISIIVLTFFTYQAARADNIDQPQIGVGNFLDEDGDGFNDLLPDTDGDGVPDALDPDYQGRHADSVFMQQQMNGMNDKSAVMQNIMGGTMNMDMHGEPGQFGPGDSTCHGGMHDGGGMDGDHHGGMDSTGMGGGMGGGKIDPGPENRGINDAHSPAIEQPVFEGKEPNMDKNAAKEDPIMKADVPGGR